MDTSIQRNYKSNLLFFVVAVLCILIIIAYPLGTVARSRLDNTPKVDNAAISFSAVNLDKGDEFFLNGTWNFYWQSFIVSDNLPDLSPTSSAEVPHSRLNYLSSDSIFSGGGYGSYKLTFSDIKAEEPITFYISNFAGAYRIYVDGALVTSCGELAENSSDTVATIRKTALPVTVDSGEHELVIEVSSNKMSGLYMSPAVRNFDANEDYTLFMLGLRYLFIGIVLFCGIFILIMKIFVNKKEYSFWGVALCAMLAFRMMISSEGYIISQSLFFGLSYEFMTILIFAATFIIKLISLVYLVRVLPIKVTTVSIVQFAFLFGTVISTAVFFENSIYDQYFSIIMQLSSYTLDLYILEKLSVCVINKVKSSWAFLFSYALVIIGLSVDFLYTSGAISFRCSMFMPLTFLVFALAVVYVHATNTRTLYQQSLRSAMLEKELTDANMSIMLSQIQPHFLYNALNTIKYLMRNNPEKAQKAIVEFSMYLRGNMDSLTQKKPILFRTELDHIKHYCEIELMRFSDKLHIEYDIQTDNFYVPTLSIQPLIENSIKHGVTKKAEGGTVTVSTYQDDDNFYVEICDDGIGFDINEIPNDERSHVGFSNIKNRLETMLHAEISVNSVTGEGTKIIVTLPKEYNIGNINIE